VDPSFYADYLDSAEVLETSAFDPALSARVETHALSPVEFLNRKFLRWVVREQRGVALFLPTRAEVEKASAELGERWPGLHAAFYHGGEPIRVLRPFLEGAAEKPYILTMTQAGQSALNIRDLDTVVIYDACYTNQVQGGRNVLARQYLGPNEILQMAGRVHGRVLDGRVYILTDRDLDFFALEPVPPDFQLAGDSERVALTAAALRVDLTDLDLPVPLDHRAYRRARARLETRGIVEGDRLTRYGRDVEAMPVDRPWGELLVHAEDDLIPMIAASSNVDSLHRMTREHADLRGLVVWGSDHLTAYNIYAEAVNQYGQLGEVYGLPRHLFVDEIDEWADDRGVPLKALEDVALGMASVYRTLELPLPRELPYAHRKLLYRFQRLLARVLPFEVVMDRETADGERVRISDSSVVNHDGAMAGTVRYFADRFGVPRGTAEGTNIPFALVKEYAVRADPVVEYREGRRGKGLVVTRYVEFGGFVLDRERHPLRGTFPDDLAGAARDALADALVAGTTPHPQQRAVAKAARRLDEYWRRSGGTIYAARPDQVVTRIREQLDAVDSFDDFLQQPIELDVESVVPADARRRMDALPSSAAVFGDRVPLVYELEGGSGIVRLRLREKQAQRLRRRDVPETDRPLRFSIYRGRREVARAASLEELRDTVARLPDVRRGRRRGRGRGRRPRRRGRRG
jgi:hypothetical protein